MQPMRLVVSRAVPGYGFIANNDTTLHIVRLAARAQCINDISRTRNDCEDWRTIDLEAQSHRCYTDWVKQLSKISKSSHRIFRCGAVQTPTRISHMTGQYNCDYCSFEGPASMKHLMVSCPHFAAVRE